MSALSGRQPADGWQEPTLRIGRPKVTLYRPPRTPLARSVHGGLARGARRRFDSSGSVPLRRAGLDRLDRCASLSAASRDLDSERDVLYLTVSVINHLVKYMADQLSATFQALADPTRRAILARLAEGDATVTELARPFTVSLPAISRHLKVLERAGLISRDRTAQYRPSSLRTDRLDDATTWMVTCREIWESRIDRLDGYLRQIQKGQPND